MKADLQGNNLSERNNRTAMSFGQELAVSGLAAGLAHVLHHPLYTLKSQMMFHGQEFSFQRFVGQIKAQKLDFLYRGK